MLLDDVLPRTAYTPVVIHRAARGRNGGGKTGQATGRKQADLLVNRGLRKSLREPSSSSQTGNCECRRRDQHGENPRDGIGAEGETGGETGGEMHERAMRCGEYPRIY